MMASKAKVNGRPAFLVLKDEIQAELKAGVFATRIYAKLKDRLPFSYRQFLYYIDQYGLRASAMSAPGAAAAGLQPTMVAPQSAPRSWQRTDPDAPGSAAQIHFQPADIDKKKLI